MYDHKVIVAGALACFALAGAPVWAAGSDPSDSGRDATATDKVLEEVMVTARRTSERLQDVPVAVTAITGDALESRAVHEIVDLTNIVPGLTVTPANSPTSLIVNIRGLGNTNPNTGSDAAVGFYLNDVPINLQNGTNLAFFDIDDVQVLKGPQGTLFGRNTTGGAILINTKRPTNQFEGYIQAGGTFFKVGNGVQGEGAINIPMGDNFAVRMAFSVQNRDGWVRNVIDRNAGPAVFLAAPLPFGPTRFDNQGYIDSKALRLSALWQAGDYENSFVWSGEKLSSTALAPNTNALNPAGPVVQFAPFLGVPDPTVAWNQLQTIKSSYYWSTMTVSNNPLTLTTNTFSDTATWKIGSLTVKNILGYRKVREEYGQDIVGLPGEYFVYRELAGGYNISEELQLQGTSFQDRLHWVTGLFYFGEDRYTKTPRETVFDGPGSTVDFDSKSKSYSLFAQGTQQLGIEGLSLTAGARYTSDRRNASSSRTSDGVQCLFPNLPAGVCLLTRNRTFSSPTYNVSLDYKWDANSLVYLATRRGYRSGGYSNTAGDDASFRAFNPENLTDYELGLKKDWHLGEVPVRTNAAIYYQDYKDIQRLVVDSSNISIQNIVNAGAATVKGAEIEVTVAPVTGLVVGYSFAYVNPVYSSFIDGGRNFKGETFAFAPHNVHNFTVAYSRPAPHGAGTLSVGADYHRQSTMYRDDEKQTLEWGPLNTLEVSAYGLLNLNAAWKGLAHGRLDASLFATNVNNVKVAPNGAPTYTSFGIGISLFSVPPLMYGINLRYRFGD
jgi:iron complex outermembrane receptor protein